MGWAERGKRIAQGWIMRKPVVPEELVPRLLELWDESGQIIPTPGNKPLTEHARIMWTARAFCKDPQVVTAMRLTHGVLPGQGSVFADLCIHLEEAHKVTMRLKL
jgi:hypothetical protein